MPSATPCCIVPSQRPFVVVRFPGLDSVYGKHTLLHRGSVVDAVLAGTRVDETQVTYTTLALVRGMPPTAIPGILAELQARYEKPAEVLRHDAATGDLLARYTMTVKDIRSPALRVMARFQVDFDAPWTHIEKGDFSMRAEAASLEQANELGARIRAGLGDAGLAPEVDVRLIGGRELGGWLEMKDLRAAHAPSPLRGALARLRGSNA